MAKITTRVYDVQPDETKRRLIAVAWLSPYDTARMRLLKIFDVEDRMAEFEQPVHSREVEQVDQDKYNEAFDWLRFSTRWKPIGVYYNGHPGLIWSALVWNEITELFADLTGPRPWGNIYLDSKDIYRAPVRFDPKQIEHPYQFIVTTRKRREMWKLRARFPCAGELMWIPLEALIQQFGYGVSDVARRQKIGEVASAFSHFPA